MIRKLLCKARWSVARGLLTALFVMAAACADASPESRSEGRGARSDRSAETEAVSTPPAIARAPDRLASDRRHYRPPLGFAGKTWGTPLEAFQRLASDPLFVQIAYSKGKVTEFDLRCMPRGQNPCDMEATLRQGLTQRVEGQGWHAFAEYYVDGQGFNFHNGHGEARKEVLLFPVTYQFCALWDGITGEPPADIQQRMKFCGVRFFFKSETEDELLSVNEEYTTRYEHVLSWLIEQHGEPEGYGKLGRVIVTTPNERITPPRKRRFSEWRWCGIRGRELAPRCAASIVLAFDPTRGDGVVLYATAPVWAFAYARHKGGVDNDPLYKLLHGLQKYSGHMCTGTNQCRSDPPQPLPERTQALFRLSQSRERWNP